MGKLKFVFTNIFLWLCMFTTALLLENLGFLTGEAHLSDSYFYLFFALSMLCYVCVFAFEHIYNKTKIDIVLALILAVFLGCGIFTLLRFRDMEFISDNPLYSSTLSYSQLTINRYIVSLVAFVVSVYALMFVYCKNKITPRRMSFIFIIVMVVCLYCTIYSIITETDSYRELFEEATYSHDIKSFFNNTNMFSGLLLMGMCASVLLNLNKKNALSYVCLFFFFFEILVTTSVLTVIVATVLIFAYFLLEIILSWKKHKHRGYYTLAIYLMIVVGVICLFAYSLDDTLGPISKLFIHVYNEGINLNVGTFSSRTEIWRAALHIVQDDPVHLFLGYGYRISSDVLVNYLIASKASYTSISSTHNGLLQILITYGLVGVGLYLLFFVYFVYACGRLMKEHTRFALLNLLVGLAMLGYSFGESVIFFNDNMQGLLVGLLFYLPAIMRYKNLNKQKNIVSVKATIYSVRSMDDASVIKTTAIVIISVLAATGPLFMFDALKANQFAYRIMITSYICLGVLLFTLPYLVYLWHKDTTVLAFKVRFILNGLLMATTFFAVALLYVFFAKGAGNFHMIFFPIVTFVITLIEIIYYSIVKRGQLKKYLYTFVTIFKTTIIASIVTIGTIVTLIYFYQSLIDVGEMKYIIFIVAGFVLFYFIMLLIPWKDSRKINEYINMRVMSDVKRAILTDELSGY